MQKIPFSVLDLVSVPEGSDQKTAMQNSLAVARHVERLGYKRFWISEHHNTDSLVSSATPLLLGYVAQGTASIRIGSGGVMLPNHAPLVVAEQFGTLATLYPGRIDLGLGRAPGTDQVTARALRRSRTESVNDFPNDIQELLAYFSDNSDRPVRAIPGEGLNVPLYLLGSSTYSAELAAALGLPYAFAAHFAPAYLHEALHLYREGFRSSAQLENPHSMVCINIVAAETDAEAEYLATSMKRFMLGVVRNSRAPLPAPVENIEDYWSEHEKAHIQNMLRYTFVGGRERLQKQLQAFIETTGADELIVVSHIYDHEKRLRSFEILKEVEIF